MVVCIHPEVHEALLQKKPVVAMESAVITHGLPREPIGDIQVPSTVSWNRETPANLELARNMERVVRDGGAVPATCALLRGTLSIGLEEAELHELATDPDAHKATAATIAGIMSAGGTAGLTISATLLACDKPAGGPIRVLATGGLGGVHRGWSDRLDISADLGQLSRSPVCVVCSGIKSLLDVPATLATLESLGIPVIGYHTSSLPLFQSPPDPALPLSMMATSADDIVACLDAQWVRLWSPGGVVIANPVPDEYAIDATLLQEANTTALADADAASIHGDALTPYVLRRLNKLTHGTAVTSNIALLLNNARLAAEVASAISRRASCSVASSSDVS